MEGMKLMGREEEFEKGVEWNVRSVRFQYIRPEPASAASSRPSGPQETGTETESSVGSFSLDNAHIAATAAYSL